MKKIILILLFLPLWLVAQQRADQLPEVESPADTDIAITVRGGSFFKTTFANLKTYFNAGAVDSLTLSNDSLLLYTSNDTLFVDLSDYAKDTDIPTLVSELTNDSGYLTAEVDGSITNEIQDISTNDTPGNITLSDGSTLTLNVEDDDADATNEIQTISIDSSGTSFTITLSDGGGSVTFEDSSGGVGERILYVSSSGDDATAEVGNPARPFRNLYALNDVLQDGDVVEILGSDTIVVDEGVYIDSLQNVTITAKNKPTVMRTVSDSTVATLTAAYSSGLIIEVESVPPGLRVGSIVILVRDSTNAGTSNRSTITDITGTTITLARTINNQSGGGVFSAAIGDKLMKWYSFVQGRPSKTEQELGVQGANQGTVIENIIFDGNSANNRISLGWTISEIGLNGQGSIIRNCVFQNYSNEGITGHGISVQNCVFRNSGGSAYHLSANDTTFAINTPANFIGNIVENTNQTPWAVSAHNEGAISLSWNGGEINIIGNTFRDVGTAVIGSITSDDGADNDREDIVFSGNRIYRSDIIFNLNSATQGVLINDNILVDCGTFSTQSYSDNDQLRICGNIARGTTVLDIAAVHQCETPTSGVVTLDEAYNNFGANPSLITVDGNEGQTGGLKFNMSASTDDFIVNLINGGAFQVNRFGDVGRYTIKSENGNLNLRVPYAANKISFKSSSDADLLTIADNAIWKFQGDTIIAFGRVRDALDYNKSGGGWKYNFEFESLTDLSDYKYGTLWNFGDYQDNGGDYTFFAPKVRLIGSSSDHRHYKIWSADYINLQNIAVRADTLSFLEWNPTITSIGAGAQNIPIWIKSGKSIFQDLNIQGGLQLSGSASAGQFLRGDGTNFVSSAIQTADIVNAGGMLSFTAAADTGTSAEISDSETLTIAGGEGIDTEISGNSVTINWQPEQYTATEASALTPSDGDLIYVTSTDATFTSVGFWGYENGSWVKL